MLAMTNLTASGQTHIAGVIQSYNEASRGQLRTQQYFPENGAFVCENGKNRFTRALYGSYTDWRVETSDRPIFAVVKKGHHRNIRFSVNGVALDSTDYCKFIDKGTLEDCAGRSQFGYHVKCSLPEEQDWCGKHYSYSISRGEHH